MTSVSTIRDELKTRLETISGLRAYDTVPGSVNPPAAVIRWRRTSYDATMARGSDDLEFVVTLFVSSANDRAAQDARDAYLATTGTTSVKAAVDGNLNSTVSFARVATAEQERLVEYAGITYLAVDFIVEVTT